MQNHTCVFHESMTSALMNCVTTDCVVATSHHRTHRTRTVTGITLRNKAYFLNFLCLAETKHAHLPIRTFCKISMNTGSDCRWTWFNSKLTCTHRSHAGLWKQKRAPFWSISRLTGGSCKKSPQRINCSPPNGRSFPLTARATRSSFCNSIPQGMCLNGLGKVIKKFRTVWSSILIHGLDTHLTCRRKQSIYTDYQYKKLQKIMIKFGRR
jgi:hypothetical protein